MAQLRNVVDRCNVSADSDKDFNACDDFLVTVVDCHIIAAALNHLKMPSVSDEPSHDLLTESLWLEAKEKRSDILETVTREIVLRFIDTKPGLSDQKSRKSKKNKDAEKEGDKVYDYARELLSYGLLYKCFADSIREGDGKRILCCWKFLMLIFKAAKRKNYAIEALNLLGQYHFFLSHRQREQLLWSRCVNTHGISGRNIPGDLYLEHLNRLCKSAVSDLGANKTPAAFERAGKCLGVLDKLSTEFDKSLGVSEVYSTHSLPNDAKDMRMILKELIASDVFTEKQNREYL